MALVLCTWLPSNWVDSQEDIHLPGRDLDQQPVAGIQLAK